MATKADLDQLATVLRQDVRSSAGELRTEMSDLRGQLRSELLRDQRNLVFSFIGANVAIATLAVTVQQLLG